MKVKDLIKELEKQNQEAEIQTLTVGSTGNWEYTSEPKVSSHKNMFGERVFIN
jgi:hypothetical protein